MTIEKNLQDGVLTFALEGRLDTATSPELEQQVKTALTDEIAKLIFDFTKLEYISSAGLRVLLGAQKAMSRRGGILIRNPNDMIMEVFDVTGFSDILAIE